MNKLLQLLNKAGLNGFFLFMMGMVVLASQIPEAASPDSPLHLREIGNVGVALIFFGYGLKLNPAQFKKNLGRWDMHLLIHATTFLIFPAIILLLRSIFYREENDLLWTGAFYLAALPSTVSASVVMVSIAGGNIPAAIFNASISSLIGIVATPLWMSLIITDGSVPMNELSSVVINLCVQVLLPVVLGLFLHRYLSRFAERNKNALRNLDQAIILLIIFQGFAGAFLNRMFDGYSTIELLTLASLMLLFFFVMLALMNFLATKMKFNRPDRITILFCGSKKSLVQGAVMGQVLFPDAAILGIVLLPLMMYHALQLLAGSILAQKLGSVKPEST